MKRMSRMEGEKPTLMVIPMIDIIFFLLVFFMISTIYTIPQQSLSIILPKTKTQQSAELRPVLIDFEKSGQDIYAGGHSGTAGRAVWARRCRCGRGGRGGDGT